MGDTMKHRAAVVAEGRRQVRENLPFVLLARLRTRNKGPGKPGPSFAIWSSGGGEIEADGSRAPLDTPSPKNGGSSSKRGGKNIKPIFQFPLSLPPPLSFLFLIP